MQNLPSPSRLLFGVMLFSVFTVYSAPSSALQPLVTDDTGTTGAGGNQIEVSFDRERTRWRNEEGKRESERVTSVPVTYTYGLTENLDIFAGIDYSRVRVSGEDDANGFGSTVVGGKWRFFENEASGTSLAVSSEIAIPVSSRRENGGLGVGKTSAGLNFILSQELPFGEIHFNAGIGRERFRDSEENATNRNFSVAPVWNVSEQWKLALDVGIDLSRSGGNTVRSRFAEIGAIYSLSEGVELAIGYIHATTD
ncbi:MAG: transporter, partial [Candidatus Accumulibacter sp.]|nr:transporter [Accumulibacter sp.]